jgi:hypothetical protein
LFLPALDFTNRTASPQTLALYKRSPYASLPLFLGSEDALPPSVFFLPYNWCAGLLQIPRPSLYLQAQATVDLARTAVALERYWLESHDYPATLEALQPQFLPALPHEVMDGKPLHYQRAVDGHYVLYEIGLDGMDRHGRMKFDSYGDVHSDWIWHQ